MEAELDLDLGFGKKRTVYIEFAVSGCYRPATMWQPEENIEIDIISIWVLHPVTNSWYEVDLWKSKIMLQNEDMIYEKLEEIYDKSQEPDFYDYYF